MPHRADTPISMQVYNAQDELQEWEIYMQLKKCYKWEDDDKDWLATKSAHHKKWKLIKQQSGKAAGSGRQGPGALPVQKKQYSWRFVAEVEGEPARACRSGTSGSLRKLIGFGVRGELLSITLHSHP